VTGDLELALRRRQREDQRTRRIVAEAGTRYSWGIVASIDLAATPLPTLAAFLDGNTKPSPGILMGEHLPVVGDQILVAQGPVRGSRWVAAMFGHPIDPRTRVLFVPLDAYIPAVPDGSTSTVAIALAATRVLSELPPSGVVAVTGETIIKDSTAAVTTRRLTVYHYDGGVAASCYLNASTVNSTTYWIAALGGDRQFQWEIAGNAAGTYTYGIHVTALLATDEMAGM
jgi:hypothetical protein